MKSAYWALLALAIALGVFGYLNDLHWLIFVGVGIVLVAVAVDPRRSFLALCKRS
jgi:hypothetical protein